MELTTDDAVVGRVQDVRSQQTSRTDLVPTLEDELGTVLVPLLPSPEARIRAVRVSVFAGALTAALAEATGSS